MSLTVVSTPIGHEKDITLHALEALKDAEVLIGEERKPTSRLIKVHRLGHKQIELLNEHSNHKDLKALTEICRTQKVALVSDCGTPGFCDPGPDLIRSCYLKEIPVSVAPGASSLMTFLSLLGRKVEQFYFRGFLPQENRSRKKELENLTKSPHPVILMDTPYRLTKTLKEVKETGTRAQCILGMDLTGPNHLVAEGSAKELLTRVGGMKSPFMLMINAPK